MKFSRINKLLHNDDEKLELYFELINGVTLHQFCIDFWERNKSFSFPFIAFLGNECSKAINQLHLLGFVHHDLKTDNIMINSSTQAILIDFSLTKPIGSFSKGFKEKSHHLPVETLRNYKIDPSIDVYSLGIAIIDCVDMNRKDYVTNEGLIDQYQIKNIYTSKIQHKNHEKEDLLYMCHLIIDSLNKNHLRRPSLRRFMELKSNFQPTPNKSCLHLIQILKNNVTNEINNKKVRRKIISCAKSEILLKKRTKKSIK